MQQRRAGQPGHEAGVLHRIPEPPAAPAELVIGPVGAHGDAQGQKDPAQHGPGPHPARPVLVDAAGNQRGNGKGKADRKADIAGVEQRRVDGEANVLQHGVEIVALERRGKDAQEGIGGKEGKAGEGRGEQVLKTDQDNALIIADDLDWNECSKVMDKFTTTLLDFGYPLCPGKIMVSNPEWVMRESEWRKTLKNWTASVEGNGLMNLAIFVDGHAVAGNTSLFNNLRDDLFRALEGNEVFYSYFAMPLRRFSTPLTFFGGLKKSDAMDIKKGGIFPIVHGIRTMALQFKIKETNTFERIEALVEKRVMKRKFADDLAEALVVLSTLRLQQQLKVETGQAALGEGNMVSAVSLNKLDRDLLREALHMVKEFKSRMSHRYHLDR